MKKKEMDINEDIQHEQLKWKIERISWIILLLTVISAFIGLLGSGPFSSRTVQSNSFTINYQLVDRYESPVEIEYITHFIPKNDFAIWINTNFLKELGDLKIHPEPKSTYVENSNSVFVFEEEKSNNNYVTIMFQFRHNKSGIKKLRTGINDNFLELTQYILP